jgi:iron complex outermembrane recepter protein
MRIVHPAPAVAALGACCLVVTAPGLAAEEASIDTRELETIVVTASRTRAASNLETAVPVDVVSAEQIASAGAFGGELAQTLQVLVPSFNLQRQSNSGVGDLVRPAQLRGMSPDQVLVLVNGKRRHTTSVTGIDLKVGRGTAPVDFNSIPTNAIKRIEVLRDGAGAQYGSDAIAGVINIILDDRAQGFDFAASYGRHETDFDPINASQSDGATTTFQGSFGLGLSENGFLRAGFEYRERDGTNRAGFDEVPFFEDSANVALVGGQRNFKPGDAATDDVNLWVNAEAGLGNALVAYGFATYNTRDAEGTGFFRYPVSSANILSVYPLGYRPITLGDNEDLALTLGLRGEAGAWRWDGSLSYGQNTFERGVRRSLNPSLGASSPTTFRSGETENELTSLNLDLSRELGIGLAAPALLAVGAEWRREAFKSMAGEPASYQAGPFAGAPGFLAIGAQAGTGLTPAEERDLDRDVLSAYAELSLALAETVQVDLAARLEDYDDFGSAVSGKLAGRWEFAPGYALRGAVSNSLRAPSLVQVGFANSATSFGAGGQLTTVNTLPVDDPLAQALGASDLDEESSTNFSLGFAARVTDRLQITIDAFRIDVDDRITLSERVDCSPGSAPPAALTLCAQRNVTAANFFTNAVNTRTEGVEIVATYAAPLASGTLDLTAAYALASTEIRSVNDPLVPGVILVGVEETNTIEDAAPEDKAIVSARWANDRLSLLGRATYYGEATRVFNFGGGFEPSQTYSSELQFDAEIGYKVLDRVEFYIGASNLFDQYPDKSNELIYYFGNLPYDVLSPIGFNGRFVYGGFRASF